MTEHERPSKSEVKREYLEITKLGQQLVALSKQQLLEFPLSEHCLSTIFETQKVTSNIGRKRQLKYLGKMLREEDLDSIRNKLMENNHAHQASIHKHHQFESWRDRLIAKGDQGISEILEISPDLDRQHLRQLIRNANNEIKNNKPPKAQRELFRYLRDQAKLDN